MHAHLALVSARMLKSTSARKILRPAVRSSRRAESWHESFDTCTNRASTPIMRSLRLPVGFALVSVIVVACSGAEPSDLFGSSGSSASPSPNSSTSGGGTDATSTSSSSSTSSTSSSSSTGGKDAAPDAPPPVLGDDDHVLCGKDKSNNDVYCATGSICCARGTTQGGMVRYDTFECLSDRDKCTGQFDAVLGCDDRNDCGQGEFCCAAKTSFQPPSMRYVRTFCQATNCAGASGRMCQPGKTGECPNNSQCKEAPDLKGFGVCSQ